MSRLILLLAALASLAAGATPPTPQSKQPVLGQQRQLRRPPSPGLAVRQSSAPALLRGGSASFLDNMPSSVAMFIGAAGIFVSFSAFAVLQEDIYKKSYGDDRFAFTFFVLVVERLINALSALLGVGMLGKSGLVIPFQDIFYSGVSQMLAMAASNEALRYVSYPTQVLGKSCKMVPVMAGGIVLGGKTYSLVEYLQVGLITLGVIIFNFGGKKKKSGAADSPFGLALIGLSLGMDVRSQAWGWDWRLAVGGWRLAVGGWRLEVRAGAGGGGGRWEWAGAGAGAGVGSTHAHRHLARHGRALETATSAPRDPRMSSRGTAAR